MLNNEKNEHLQGVPPEVLEEYVLEQIRQFAVEFAQQLVPQITQQHLDLAFSRALYALSARSSQQALKLQLRFTHKCKYLGCSNMDCPLCKHNPHKTCGSGDNFDEAYADNQVLRARCEADVYVELYNASTGEVFSAPGVEVQLVTIDGEYYDPAAPSPLHTIKTLLAADNGTPLLQASGANRPQINGTVVVPLQGGRARLPDVFIADKNDTAKFEGATAGKFALMALAVRRGEGGQLVAIDHVTPAVSNPFVVKTQRALNDYRKSAFPHYKDEITRLRYIGVVSANRLKDARAHLGEDVPVACVDTVQDLKKIVEYAETNRKVENKLLEMLNMRGRHKHKWDSLRQVLSEKIVYDDNHIRVWLAPDGSGQGLLYYAKQAQVALDKPAALAQNMMGVDGYPHLQVMDIKDMQEPTVSSLVQTAEECWRQNNHAGWQILSQPIERVTAWSGVPVTTAAQPNTPAAVAAMAAAAAAAAAAAGGGAAAAGGGGVYPPVPRNALGQVPAQLGAEALGGQQLYPTFAPGGMPAEFNAAAAAAAGMGEQAAGPLRNASDVAMSSLSGTEGAAPLPPAADEAQDSAFMRQHAFDNVERALHESEALDGLRHPSGTSDAGTAAAAAAAAVLAAAAAGRMQAEGGNGNKRSRGAVGDDEEVIAAAAGGGGAAAGGAMMGPRGLYHRESAGRHLPVARANPSSSDAPGAAGGSGGGSGGADGDGPLDMPLPSELPSFTPKDMANLLEQLSSGMVGAAGGAAAAGNDQQQQQDQNRAGAAAARGKGGSEPGAGGELVLTNSLSALNLANSLLPPSTLGRAGAGAAGGAAGGVLAPTGSSLLLPMSGDMNSLRLLSSLAFLHSNLRTEDSFKQVLNQVNLGSPRHSGGLEALLQEPTAGGNGGGTAAAAAGGVSGGGGGGGGAPAAAPAAAGDAGPFAAAAAANAAAAGSGSGGGAGRSRLVQESH